MSVDLAAARRFVRANARLLDVHRTAFAFDGTSVEPALRSLRAYRNDDGGFGHGIEPDVRSPSSETTSTLHALEVLDDLDALDDPMVPAAAAWAATVTDADGNVPFLLPASLEHPRGPWMQVQPGGCHLGFGYAGLLTAAGVRSPFVDAVVGWSWARLESDEELDSYWIKYALMFLDRMPDDDRRRRALDRVRGLVRDDGSVPVAGGTEGEQLTVLTLAPRPGTPGRTVFTDEQVAADLDRLAAGQRDDGGWTVDYLPWTPAQAVEWRGLATLLALQTLRAEGRV